MYCMWDVGGSILQGTLFVHVNTKAQLISVLTVSGAKL